MGLWLGELKGRMEGTGGITEGEVWEYLRRSLGTEAVGVCWRSERFELTRKRGRSPGTVDLSG